MKIGHDGHDDMCDAYLTETLRFDASELISTVAAVPFNTTVLQPGDTISALYEASYDSK
jgi:hypothetical protein